MENLWFSYGGRTRRTVTYVSQFTELISRAFDRNMIFLTITILLDAGVFGGQMSHMPRSLICF